MLSGVSSRLGDIERRQDRSEDTLLASVDAKLARAFSATSPSAGLASAKGVEESKAAASSERELGAGGGGPTTSSDEGGAEAIRIAQLTELHAKLEAQRALLESAEASASGRGGAAGAVLSVTKGARAAGAGGMSRLCGLASHVDDE
jgi:hypothetical protein